MVKVYLTSNKMCQPRIPLWSFPGSSAIKNLPANAGDMGLSVQSLGQEGPLEKELAIHSSVLAWRIPWTGEPRGLTDVYGVTQSWT